MKSAARTVLDVYNSVLDVVTPPVRMAHPTNIDQVTLLESGEWKEENSLEARVGGGGESHYQFGWQAAQLYRLKNVWMTGDQAQVFLESGELFEPWVAPYDVKKLKIRRPLKVGVKKFSGPLVHLTGRNHENRGHFMLQHLPRLMAARNYLQQLGDYRILVAPGHSRWQKRYINWLGLDPERVVEGTHGTMFAEDLIFVPNLYDKSGLCPPKFYAELSDAARDYPTQDGPGRALFITRRDAPDKQLINEERIVEILREMIGEVDVIQLGKYPLPEQIGMFRAAPLVMGPIGQGICNILFCKTTLLVTLAPGSEDKQVYTTAHGSQMARMCGNAAATFLSSEAAPSRGDWAFPEERFKMLMAKLLTQPEAVRLVKAKTA